MRPTVYKHWISLDALQGARGYNRRARGGGVGVGSLPHLSWRAVHCKTEYTRKHDAAARRSGGEHWDTVVLSDSRRRCARYRPYRLRHVFDSRRAS